MKITKWHRHEALDRTMMIIDIIDRQLYYHSALKGKDRKKLDDAMDILFDLYQKLGAENAKKEKHTKG